MGPSKLLNNLNTLSRSVSSLQKVFDCPICLDVLDDPVRTTVCGHTFCRKCINKVLKSDTQKKPCPLCNVLLTHRSIAGDDKTTKFLHLTLELIRAISLDTRIDITEYRDRCQSTKEASQNSEDLFKSKKTNSRTNKTEIKSKFSSTELGIDEIIKPKRNGSSIVKSKLTDYYSSGEKSTDNKVVKKSSIHESDFFKKPFSKGKVDIKDGFKTGLENADSKKVVDIVETEKRSFFHHSVHNKGCTDISPDDDADDVLNSLEYPCENNIKSAMESDNEILPSDNYCDDISDFPDKVTCVDQNSDNALEIKSKNDDKIFVEAETSSVNDRGHQISVGKDNDNGIRKTNDKIDENSYEVIVPFKLVGGLSSLKEIKELKNRRQKSFSVPFVLFGTLEMGGKKRKFDEFMCDDGDNYNLNIDDIRKISLFPSDRSGITKEKQNSRSVEDMEWTVAGIENGEPCNVLNVPSARKKFCPSVSTLPQKTFLQSNNNDTVSKEKQIDFVPSQSPMSDYDIFDADKEINLNHRESNDVEHLNCPDLDKLVSISQITPQRSSNFKPDNRLKMNSNYVNDLYSSDGHNSHDENITVINENVVFNKSKLKVCQRGAVFLKPLPKTINVASQLLNRSEITSGSSKDFSVNEIENSKAVKMEVCQREDTYLKSPNREPIIASQLLNRSEITSVSKDSRQNISVNKIENSEPDSSGSKYTWGLNENLDDMNKNLSDFNCKGDISVNEIENSEPTDHKLKSKGFFSKMEQIRPVGADVNLDQNKNSVITNPKIPLNACVSEDSELQEIASDKEQKQSLCDDDDDNDKNVANRTVIEASDDDIDDSISQTPPNKTMNASGLELGGLLSQRIKIQNNIYSTVVTDSESNEIPSSLNDISHMKSFNSNLMASGMNVIPSAHESAIDEPVIEPVPVPSETSKLGIMSNYSEDDENINAKSIDLNQSKSRNMIGESSSKSDDINNLSNVNKNFKNISLVYSRLTDLQVKDLKNFAFRFEADITDQIIEGMTTHVILCPEENNRALHTFKYLKGVASRLWVISIAWVSDCLEAGKLLPEENYLVLDLSGEPGPLRCRQPSNLPPLRDFIVFPLPPFTSATVEQVNDLIMLCGGEITPIWLLSDPQYKPGIPRIVIMDNDVNPNIDIKYWLEERRSVSLNYEWLLEVVGQFKLVPINCHMMAPYSRQILSDLFIPDELIDDGFEDGLMNEL